MVFTNNNRNLTSREVQDLCRPRRKPARTRRPHAPLSIETPGQTVIGRSRVNSQSGNFSHIRIVPKESTQRPEQSHDPAITQNPSFGEEAAKNMEAYQVQTVAPTASLANLTSGTTFAAKARAAELNAVRARKAAKEAQEAEPDHGLPSAQPISLGSLKLTMPRNRGVKAWKPLDWNIDEVPETPIEEGVTQTVDGPSTAQVTSQGLSGEQPPVEDKRAVDFDNRATSHAALTHQGGLTDEHRQPSYNPSTTGQHWTSNMPIRNPSQKPTSMYPAEALPPRAGTQYGYRQHLRPVPAHFHAPQPSSMFKPANATKHLGDDDPFTEQPKNNGPKPPPFPNFASKPQGLHLSTAAHNQPTPVKGTMDVNFRFPETVNAKLGTPTSADLTLSTAVPKVSLPPTTQKQTTPGGGAYARDPKPYTSYSMSKKEMLLQNLNQVVESSKAKGDLPNANRTVLYDPFAPDTGNDPQSGYVGTRGKQSEGGKDFLKTSEPEGYPGVNVVTSPFAYGFEEPEAPQFPPGLCKGNEYIYSLAHPPKPAKRSAEELDSWWKNDTRAQAIPRAVMDDLANTRFSTDPPGYRSTSDSFGSLASPASNKTGSSLAPIGSERSAKTVGSHPLVNANEDLGVLMKQACVNLMSYVVPSEKSQDDYFGQCRFAQVPEWCIDKSPNGNDSFFGDWGVPPSRVGRDPRYRPTLHEGRYTVFAEMKPGSGRDAGLARRYH